MNELERTLMTIGCRDTDVIAKVPGAGSIVREGDQQVQIMHNGLRVLAGGYYGDWMAQIIRGLQGHHEPQEELVFHHLLRYVRHNTRMAELGAFWSYYTLWFLREVPGSTALCVEPDAYNLSVGKHNAWLNQLLDRVEFRNAWIGGEAAQSASVTTEHSGGPIELPVMDMNAVLGNSGGGPLELVHLDIQGAELALIRSMKTAVAAGLLRFVMVSTHHSSISGSKTTHPDCVEALRSLGAHILVEHDVIESFSGDGLVLASFYREDANLPFPEISRNRAQTSLFGTA